MEHRIVAGKYELLKEAGRGGSSIVYLASDLKLNKNWAIKEIIKNTHSRGQSISNTLLAEATLMKNLDHPTLPRIVDIIEEQDRYYIVMDYVEGETLKSILAQYGPQEQEIVIKWGIELAFALRYLHSLDPPIIYRDMKPANIILQPNNTLKLIDFGIARTYKEHRDEDTVALGTKGYAAPEQFQGKFGQTDARTDIYNLGVTLYELLTGKVPSDPPYELLPLREVDASLSVGLEKIIQKATKQNPEDRIQTAEDFIELLQNYQNLDEDYIHRQKKKLRKMIIPFVLGITAIGLSCCLFILNSSLATNQYEKLLANTGDTQTRLYNLEKAVQIKPQELDAYSLLLEEMANGGLTEKESQKLLAIYNEAIREVSEKTDAYCEINYLLGEGYLLHYTADTDQSLRSKLIMSLPFFEAVVNSENTEYTNYNLAKAYVDLGNFYKNYIIGSNTIFVKEAGKSEYETILSDAKKIIQLLDADRAGENNQLKVITYNLILNVIDSQRLNLATCISKDELLKIIGTIEDVTKKIKATNAEVMSEKKETLSLIGDLRSKVSASYENMKRGKE